MKERGGRVETYSKYCCKILQIINNKKKTTMILFFNHANELLNKRLHYYVVVEYNIKVAFKYYISAFGEGGSEQKC